MATYTQGKLLSHNMASPQKFNLLATGKVPSVSVISASPRSKVG